MAHSNTDRCPSAHSCPIAQTEAGVRGKRKPHSYTAGAAVGRWGERGKKSRRGVFYSEYDILNLNDVYHCIERQETCNMFMGYLVLISLCAACPILFFFCLEQSYVPIITSGADGIIATACHDDADTVVTGASGFYMFWIALVRMTTQPRYILAQHVGC